MLELVLVSSVVGCACASCACACGLGICRFGGFGGVGGSGLSPSWKGRILMGVL